MLTEPEIRERLELMEADPQMITKPAYRANALLWPDNIIPFVDSHLEYLKSHKTTVPAHYLSNLRLMLRKK